MKLHPKELLKMKISMHKSTKYLICIKVSCILRVPYLVEDMANFEVTCFAKSFTNNSLL